MLPLTLSLSDSETKIFGRLARQRRAPQYNSVLARSLRRRPMAVRRSRREDSVTRARRRSAGSRSWRSDPPAGAAELGGRWRQHPASNPRDDLSLPAGIGAPSDGARADRVEAGELGRRWQQHPASNERDYPHWRGLSLSDFGNYLSVRAAQ